MDQPTIELLQSFGYNIGQSLIASAIVEGKKLKDDRAAKEKLAWLSDVEHSKALSVRIQQKICEGLRGTKLLAKEFEVLLPLASDSILSTELARQIISDVYTQDSIVTIIVQQQPSLKSCEIEIQHLANVLIQSIQNAIASDPHLHRVKELQFQARTTGMLNDLNENVEAGNVKTLNFLNQLSAKMDLLWPPSITAGTESVADFGQIKSIFQNKFSSAREELKNGSIVVAEHDYKALIVDLESLGTKADVKLLCDSYLNLGTSLWQQHRREEALPYFEKASRMCPGETKTKTKMALCHLHRKEWDKALSILNIIRTEEPNNFESLYLIAAIQTEHDELDSATATLKSQSFEIDNYYLALAQIRGNRSLLQKL